MSLESEEDETLDIDMRPYTYSHLNCIQLLPRCKSCAWEDPAADPQPWITVNLTKLHRKPNFSDLL